MIKNIIYGVLGFSASALLIGNMLGDIPDVYLASTTVAEGNSETDIDHQNPDDMELYPGYYDEYFEEFGEYPDGYDDQFEHGGELDMPKLFNTYHISAHELPGLENTVVGKVGKNNPMFYYEDEEIDYSSGATYEWGDTVDNAEIEEGVMLGYDTKADASGGEQIKPIETLSIEEKFREYAVLPVDKEHYQITSLYGPRIDPINNEAGIFHGGLDMASATVNGSNVYSVLPGVVSYVGDNPTGYGHFVVVNHGDFTTLYAHFQKAPTITVGTDVDAGDVLGIVGTTGRSTGPHLHLEVDVDDVKIDPKPLLDLVGTGTGKPLPARPEATDDAETAEITETTTDNQTEND